MRTSRQKHKGGPLSHTIYKKNSEQIEDLNVRVKIVEILEENSISHDLGLNNGLVDIKPKAEATKEKNGFGLNQN